MVEINNQRKAFLDMLAWSEGTDNGRTKPEKSWLWRQFSGGPLLITPITLATTLNSKTQINRRRTLPASFPLVGCLPQAAWPERLLSESQDAVALQQIKERGALPMIDRGDIRQAIDRCSNIWASLPGAGYGQFPSIRLTAWLQNSKKRAERSERLMYEQSSPRLSPLWLSASSSACHIVNHYRDNAITYKAQRDKNARELKLANAAITDMQMRQRDVAALDAKYTKELAMLKLKVMLCVMMLPLVVVGCTSSSLSVSTKPPPPPAWIMQLPPTGRHRWTDYFTLRERLITMQKQLEGTQKYINEQCR